MTITAVEWSQGIEDAWSDVASFIPKLFGFLAILVIGWFVAKAIAKIADKALERVGFDEAVERGGIKKALSKSQYDASDILGKVVFYALFLLVLQMAFGVFGQSPVSDMIEGVVAYLPNVLVAIIVVVLAAAIAAAARTLIENMLGGLSYGRALANVTAGAVVAVGVFMALDQLQIAPAIVTGLFYAILALVVGSGIIAIGFGGVQPMQARWERALAKIDEEAPRARAEMQARRGEAVDAVVGQATATMSTSSTASRSTPAQRR